MNRPSACPQGIHSLVGKTHKSKEMTNFLNLEMGNQGKLIKGGVY